MAWFPNSLIVWCIFLLVRHSIAQSNGSALGTGACGDNITSNHPWYQIRFISYCNTRLYALDAAPAIPKSSFKECSLACVEQGITCGGFAFDRTSHISKNNCYIGPASDVSPQTGPAADNDLFDSAVMDNSSIPFTRRDCNTKSSGVYQNYKLRCGQRIVDNNVGSNRLDATFASSLTDCIDHCYNARSAAGDPVCQAVTWDPTLLNGYDNCILKGSGYMEPTVNGSWDSATLVGTVGRDSNDISTNSSSVIDNGTTNRGMISAGATAGAVVGGIVGFIVVAVVVFFGVRYARRRRPGSEKTSTMEEATKTDASPLMTQPIGVSNAPPVRSLKGKERAVDDDDEVVVAGPSHSRHVRFNDDKPAATSRVRYA